MKDKTRLEKAIIHNMVELSPKIRIRDIMKKDIKILHDDDYAQSFLQTISNFSISGVVIVNEKDVPVGIVSEGDLLKKVFLKRKDPKKVRISEIMTPELQTVSPDLTIDKAVMIMDKKRISKLPVMEDKKLVGYITKTDLLERLHDIYSHNRKLLWLGLLNVILMLVIVILVIDFYIK